MKLVMNERVKYRLTGLIVILSIAVIFVPAMVKKSNRHLEENVNLAVRLPAKPIPPKVVATDAKALFQTVKVAHADIPKVVEKQRLPQIAKAEPLSTKSVVPSAPTANKVPVLAKAASVSTPPVKNVAASKKPVKTVALKKGVYAVQIASFTQQENAKSLVTRLRSKGYVASYNKISGKHGDYYKVIVGQLNQKDEAKNLQKKLALSMQLNGFVVLTGVS